MGQGQTGGDGRRGPQRKGYAMSENLAARQTRAIALVGPYGSGKSALFGALMEAAGTKLRKSADARNRMDTESHLGRCSYLGDAWSIVDCPGSIEFLYDSASALAVVDLAVLVCEPVPARAATTAPIFRLLQDLDVPFMVFINKIDTPNVQIRDTLDALQAYAKAPLVLRQVPITEQEKITGYVDLVSERAYRYRSGQASEQIQLPAQMRAPEEAARSALIEVLADHDDALLEKVLEEIAPTQAEIYQDLRKDLLEGSVHEVLLGSSENANGVRRLWKALRHETPGARATAARHGIKPEGPPLAQVFRTVHAGHSGKLSYARVWRGAITDGATLNGTRLGGIHQVQVDETVKVARADEGELVALGRLEGVPTGATLSTAAIPASLPFPKPSPPVYARAVGTADRKDDVKLSGALQKLVEEDPALSVEQNLETGETLLRGQGEIHLQTAIDRMLRNYGLKLTVAAPAVAYKETIRQAVSQHARLKRQTGGHGQFADVKLEIAPRPRGAGFQFIDKIVGGAVPRQYIPAVGEAAQDAAQKGPFGYPVVDIAVTLVDGTFHSVDSSDMAFKTATRLAMTEGLAKADPVLLEPIAQVTISVPNEHTARAQRLLTGHRGQILGYAEKPGWEGWDDVQALVPQAELQELIIELRSQTMGLGTYVSSFDHLAESR
jgi:elongation factor G